MVNCSYFACKVLSVFVFVLLGIVFVVFIFAVYFLIKFCIVSFRKTNSCYIVVHFIVNKMVFLEFLKFSFVDHFQTNSSGYWKVGFDNSSTFLHMIFIAQSQILSWAKSLVYRVCYYLIVQYFPWLGCVKNWGLCVEVLHYS